MEWDFVSVKRVGDSYKMPKSTKSVLIVASGYAWTCPECGGENVDYEIYNVMVCKGCKAAYGEDQCDVTHAYH